MNKLRLILIGTVLCFSAFSQDYKSTWLEEPLIIDGKNQEWKDMPRYYDSGTLVMHETFNDSENLYLIMEVISKEIQMKLMNVGFQLSFTTKIKPKVKANIKFLPTAIGRPEMKKEGEKDNPKERLQQYLLKNTYAEISGFCQSNTSINRNVNTNERFTYNVGWTHDQHMLFELKIPLNELFSTPLNLEQIIEKPLGFALRINAMERPSGNNRPEGGMSANLGGGGASMSMSAGGGRGPGGAGGGPGGGPGGAGGGSGANSQEQQTLFSAQTFKAKIHLSSKKE